MAEYLGMHALVGLVMLLAGGVGRWWMRRRAGHMQVQCSIEEVMLRKKLNALERRSK